MLHLLDTENLGLNTIAMPTLLDAYSANAPGISASSETGGPRCGSCAVYRPGPQPDGNLQVDPEIHLPSPGMNVDIAYYYNSNTDYNGAFGYGRTISTNLLAQASGTPTLVSFSRGNGAMVSYLEDGSGNFVPQSPRLFNTLVKDTANSLWKEVTPDGLLTAYPLDTSGQVTSVTYAEDAVGNRHSFIYQAGRLQNLQDAVGRLVTFNYVNMAVSPTNSMNLLQAIEDWAGRRTSFAYDATSVQDKPLLTTVTGPSGCQTAYHYDSNPYLIEIVDPNGYSTSYSYDGNGRVVTRGIAGSGTTLYEYQTGWMVVTNPLGAIATYALDANRNLAGQIDPLGSRTTFINNRQGLEVSRRDMLGAITTTVYGEKGSPLATINPLGYITTIQRDSYQNPTTMIYANGAITTQVWGYAGSGFDTTGAKRRLQASVDALGNRTSYAYNGRGQLIEAQDALSNVTTTSYDSLGNPVSVTDPLGNVSTMLYDLAGNVTGRVNPLGAQWTYSYDAQNRLLEATDPLGNMATRAYDGVGNLVVQINPLSYRTTYTYNVFDKPVTVQNALGYTTTLVYDVTGRTIAVGDALGNQIGRAHV